MKTIKTFYLTSILAFFMICAGQALALVGGTVRYFGDPHFLWKSGLVMDQTNIVQGVINVSGSFEAPTTNSANNYLGTTDTLSISPSTPPNVGYFNSAFAALFLTRGDVGGMLETDGNTEKDGLIRVFSDMTITGAAYCVDGLSIPLKNPPDGMVDYTESKTCEKANPAYLGVAFDTTPNVVSNNEVLGSVNVSGAGGNNTLPTSFFVVRYSTNDGGDWHELDTSLNSDGDFSGTISGYTGTALVYAVVKDSDTLRSGFPATSVEIVEVAEQPTPVVTITDPNGGTNYSTDIGAHSTNIVGTVDLIPDTLVWSNALTSTGGDLTATNSFDESVSLSVGVNIITVYATKSGKTGTDSITITVNDVSAPVVTITDPNGGTNYSTDIGAHSTNIVGTVDVIPDSLVWSNSLTSAGGDLTATNSFDESVSLSVGVNIITVYATKSGKTGTDSISITVNDGPLGPLVQIMAPNGGEDFATNKVYTENIIGTIDVTPDTVIWSNALDNSGGSLPVSTFFNVSIPLKLGENIITIYATKDGETGSDSMNILITESPIVVINGPNGGDDYAVALGPHSTNITGMVGGEPDSVVWSNAFTGAGGSLGSVNTFDFNVQLTNGDNIITVYATKGSERLSDTIIIGVVPTHLKYVKITAPNDGNNYITSLGPHTTNIVGIAVPGPAGVVWTNHLTGTSGNLGMAGSFSFPVDLTNGQNLIEVIAFKEGFSIVSDTIVIGVINPGEERIFILEPNSGKDFFITGETSTNIYGIVAPVPDSLVWTNSLGGSGELSLQTTFDFPTDLKIGANVITIYAEKDGSPFSESITITVKEQKDVKARVLETWPRYIGKGQSGTVEFVSNLDASWQLKVVNMPGNSTQTVANGICTAGWNLVHFYGDDLPIDDDESSNLFQLVIGEELGPVNMDTLDAFSATQVDDIDLGGIPNTDFDKDQFFVTYKGTGNPTTEGRTIFIDGGTAKDKLSIKVKAMKGEGDGVVALCGVIVKNGALKMIKHSGDLDRLQVDGIFGKLMIKGGSLGTPSETIRYNCRFNSQAIKSKSMIMLKAGKNKNTKLDIPANCYANILAGELASEPNNVNELAGLKAIKITGGNLGVEYNKDTQTTYRHWLTAKYTDMVMVKPKKDKGGKTFDYSFYFTGEGKPNKGSFKKLYFNYGLIDSSDSEVDGSTIVCGYDDNINPVNITGTNWIGKEVEYGFGKIQTKAGGLQGTIAIKNFSKGKIKQVKIKGGTDEALWIIDGEEE